MRKMLEDRTEGGASGGRHFLSNERLLVELAGADWCAKPRFDRTGFITQVTLKELNRTYCAYELDRPDPDAGGGLCGEFGLQCAVGYEDAKPGEWFVKPGVGLLKKEDNSPYDFKRSYELAPFGMAVEYSGHEARYSVHPRPCRGYVLAQTKTVTLQDNEIIIRYGMNNCGSKDVITNEYVHNFLRVASYPVGPDYSLQFSFPLKQVDGHCEYDPDIVLEEGNGLKWNKQPSGAFYLRLDTSAAGEWAGWELLHKPSGARISEECSNPLDTAAVWGMAHTVSPEMFVALRLAPGQTANWTRRYRFS
jgi:hypothetical protein